MSLEPRGPISSDILEELCRVSDGSIVIALNVGKKVASDFTAYSISRLRAQRGQFGHLMDNAEFSAAALPMIHGSEYFRLRDEFTQHMTRQSREAAVKSPHNLVTPDDYNNYFNIIYDAVAAELLSRGIDQVVFFNIPHLGYDTVIFHIARAFDIPVIILTQSILNNRVFSMTDPDHMGLFVKDYDAPVYPIAKHEKPNLFYMDGIEQGKVANASVSWRAWLRLASYILRKRKFNLRYLFDALKLASRVRKVYGILPNWRDPFAKFFNENELAYFEHVCKLEEQPADLSGDFVYFPLQKQPEMTTSSLGDRFVDQAYAIECLAAILPRGVRILVKENPKQGAYMRGPLFFHRLKRIPAVTWVPSYTSTHELTEKAKFVATVTGTVGWEAIRQGKPALVFGRAWYRKLLGVVEYKPDLTYDNIANLTWENSELEQATGALFAASHDCITDINYAKAIPDFDAENNKRRVAKLLYALITGESKTTFCEPETNTKTDEIDQQIETRAALQDDSSGREAV